MSLLSMLKEIITPAPKPTHTDETADSFSAVFNKMVKEYTALANQQPYSKIAFNEIDSYAAVKSATADEKKQWLFYVAQVVAGIKKKYSGTYLSPWGYNPQGVSVEEYMRFRLADDLQSNLLKTDGLLSGEDLAILIHLYADNIAESRYVDNGFPIVQLTHQAEKIFKGKTIPESVQEALKRMLMTEAEHYYLSREHKANNQKIELLLHGNAEIQIDPHDAWGKELLEWLFTLPVTEKQNWIALLQHCIEGGAKSSPVAKWLSQAEKLVAPVGQENLIQKMQEWLGTNTALLKKAHKEEHWVRSYLRDTNMNLLKGLIWCCAQPGATALHRSLLEYATIAYKKKPGVGPLAVSGGSACMQVFSKLPVKEGVPLLLAVRNKLDNKSILKTLDKLVGEVAVKNNISPESIEEIAAPDLGMQNVGILQITLGDHTAWLKAQPDGTMELSFEKGGKSQTSVPAPVKQHFATELKTLKATQKTIEEQLRAHTERLENSYLKPREWHFADWAALYLQHPLLGIIGRRLIWHFDTDGAKQQGIFENDQLVNVYGEPLQGLNEKTKVQLWHPISFDAAYVLVWRNYFRIRQVAQPFKQAFREVYIVTDAELRTFSYSNRFAAHILRQHQFTALARQRGWQYTLMGNWDSHNTPVKLIPHWQIVAEFFVDADWNGETASSGVFTYISTDQVRFKKGDTLLNMDEIPAMVFTEIMRDVDLFVGVCSVGNDQNWVDGGNQPLNAYWHSYSFSDLTENSKIRMETLQFLIPKMKIAAQCSFDKKFLHVQGKLRHYKIHMGSGNILMEPNDQYLCIVPGGRDKSVDKMFLPFEGDAMLSIIISKALLLAEDDTITDVTITRQL